MICRISPFLVTRILANSPAGAVSIRHGLRGPNRAVATACAAGADAIGDAFHLIRSGNADVMVAGGTEACVDAVALGAFGRSSSRACCDLYMSRTACCGHILCTGMQLPWAPSAGSIRVPVVICTEQDCISLSHLCNKRAESISNTCQGRQV